MHQTDSERQAERELPEALQYLAEENDHETIAAIIKAFQIDTASRLDLLRSALDDADAAEIRRQAHAISGSARLVGADAMAHVCRQIETAAVVTEELRKLVEQVGAHFEEACRTMEAVVGDPDTAPAAKPSGLSNSAE